MVIGAGSRVRHLAVCVVFFLGLVPRFAAALELGPIETRSVLYEPLDARIPVRDAQSGDLKGLNVVLGSPAQFELAGVARLQHLKLLRFVVVEQGEGGGYIHVRTDEPIIEPSLTFLIDVDWPRGRTVRGYRVQLASAPGRGAGANQAGSAESPAQPVPDTSTPDAAPASGGVEYGPVRRSETLWSIADRMRPDKSVSVQRMMLAILRLNPNAFEIGNVNALNAGTMLGIPGRGEIGPDNLGAAIAEVRRQHSEWTRYRNEARATPTPSEPMQETSSSDSATAPSGRLEVVSPESTTPNQEERTQVATLRKELALAVEEADAGRRENDELKLRLAEADDHIRELNRLVELKNEEIAALRSELHEAAPKAPEAAAGPEEAEPKPDAEPEEGTRPVLAPEELESKPAAPPASEETKPVLTPADTETISVPAPAETEPKPTAEGPEPKSLPFGLGSLPVNPVFLVGGAGLLLILLGVVALLRRRATSAGEDAIGVDDALETAESSPPGEDDLLLELEAVAADLSEEQGDPNAPQLRAGPAHPPDSGAKPAPERRDRADTEPEDIAEERIAQLWQDDRAVERDLGEEFRSEDDSSELTFEIDALTAEDPDLNLDGDDASDEFDIGDLADLADLSAEREMEESDRTTGEPPGNLDLLFSRHEALAEDLDTPATDAGHSTDFDPETLDEKPDGGVPAAMDERESRARDADVARAPAEDGDVESEAAVGRDVDDDSTVDDESGGADPAPTVLHDESTEDGEPEAFPLEEFGEDEVQTKIDLAQVYMEMGDTESARGFLEAALAEGNAEQQEAAREMLTRLG